MLDSGLIRRLIPFASSSSYDHCPLLHPFSGDCLLPTYGECDSVRKVKLCVKLANIDQSFGLCVFLPAALLVNARDPFFFLKSVQLLARPHCAVTIITDLS